MPEPTITLTPAELVDAARLGVTPEDYLAAKRVQLARSGGLETGGLSRPDYEALDAATRSGRGAVNAEQFAAATGRDQYGRKIKTGDQS